MSEQEQKSPLHAGSVTSSPTPPKPEPEPKMTEPETTKSKFKTKKKIGQYEYIGQDDTRFLFRDRESKKCYTVDKTLLQYRGEGKFRVKVMESLQK